jgi:hypothetical protein
MPSEKTRALRERDLEIKLKLLTRPLTVGGGYMSELKEEAIVSSSRRNRLKAEKLGCTRAQRLELRQKRHDRLWLGVEPPQPEWAKAQKSVDVNELAAAIAEAEPTEEPIDMSAAQTAEESA